MQKGVRSFLKNSSVKDSELVRKQWSAAWMTYKLARFGGKLEVNFKYNHERKDIQPVKPVSPLVREEESIRGKKFSVILKDIAAGSLYKDSKSKQNYNTFGDCDEVSLLMSQLIKAMNDSNNLGMKTMVYRVDQPHANSAVTIGGKWFLLEPSLGQIKYPEPIEKKLKEWMEAGKGTSLESTIRKALITLARTNTPPPIYSDDYEKKVPPKLNAILNGKPELWPNWQSLSVSEKEDVKKQVSIPKISPSQQRFIYIKLREASVTSSEQAIVERETMRRMWGYKPSRIGITISNAYLPKALKEPGGTRKAIRVLSDFIAASTEGQFDRNQKEINGLFQGKDEKKILMMIKDLSINMTGESKYSMDYVRKRLLSVA